jgi:hypothetical protein
MQDGKIKENLLILVACIHLFALAPPVTVTQDRHFVLISPDQPGDILLVGKYDEQGDGNGKSAVKGFVCIEDIEDEYGKSQAGKDGTQ